MRVSAATRVGGFRRQTVWLRLGGQLIFITNGVLLMACTPADGGRAGDRLVRGYFASYRLEFPEDYTVEFHPRTASGSSCCAQLDSSSKA